MSSVYAECHNIAVPRTFFIEAVCGYKRNGYVRNVGFLAVHETNCGNTVVLSTRILSKIDLNHIRGNARYAIKYLSRAEF